MIESVRIRNFKAIREAEITLDGINAFIGNNGSGKSSVIEALQTLQSILEFGLTEGINKRWVGLEHIRHLSAPENDSDIHIEVSGKFKSKEYKYYLSCNKLESNGLYVVKGEKLEIDGERLLEISGVNEQGLGDSFEAVEKSQNSGSERQEYGFEISSFGQKNQLMSRSILEETRIEQSGLHLNANTHSISTIPQKEQSLKAQFKAYILNWYFINIQPESLYFPVPKDFSTFFKGVDADGKNLADYLWSLDRSDKKEMKEIILEKLRTILPYINQLGANDIQVQNLVYLFLTEHRKQIPSWLLSTGTLRALTLLTLFNTVTWPCVFFIEEMENTLDPRTLNLLVDEMDRMTPGHQFVITTHSPYLLDLLEMQHIIVAERMEKGPFYSRPDERQDLAGWKEKFSPGKLYTMNKLTQA